MADNSFYVVGSQDELAIVSPGWGVMMLEECQLCDCTFDMRYPSPIDIRDRSSTCAAFIQGGKPHIDITLKLVAQRGRGCESVPASLRMADDMTVMELLGAVNRQLQDRKG